MTKKQWFRLWLGIVEEVFFRHNQHLSYELWQIPKTWII
jgi:hypothetical protein